MAKRETCRCDAYPFPHARGGGRCHDGREMARSNPGGMSAVDTVEFGAEAGAGAILGILAATFLIGTAYNYLCERNGGSLIPRKYVSAEDLRNQPNQWAPRG